MAGVGRQRDAVAVARSEQRRLAAVAVAVDRSDGMDDVARGQIVSAGDACLAGRAAVGIALGALAEEARAGGPLDRACDAYGR